MVVMREHRLLLNGSRLDRLFDLSANSVEEGTLKALFNSGAQEGIKLEHLLQQRATLLADLRELGSQVFLGPRGELLCKLDGHLIRHPHHLCLRRGAQQVENGVKNVAVRRGKLVILQPGVLLVGEGAEREAVF